MRSYVCYVHKASQMTPQMRVLAIEDTEELPEVVRALVHETPEADRFDVYDDDDRLVASLGRRGLGLLN